MEEHDNNSVGDIFDAFDGQNDEIEISSASETEEQLRDEIIDGNANEDENKTDNFQSEFIDNLSPQEPEENYPSIDDGDQKEEYPQSEGEEKFLSTTNGNTESKPFDAQKKSAFNAIKGRRPPILNKQRILYIMLGIVTFLIVFGLFIFPSMTKKKQKASQEKPHASENEAVDYFSLAKKRERQLDEKAFVINNEKDDKLDEDELPPINPKYQNNRDAQTVYVTSNSNTSKKEIPDTSEDALQAKTINGIKGITPTRNNYLSPDHFGNSYAQNTSQNIPSNTQNYYPRNALPSQSEYTNQILSQYANTQNNYARQNDQSGKSNFFNANRGETSGSYIPLNSIWQGSIFNAILTSNINTDLPGECTAIISKNIYSSQDGSLLLIPQNSKLLGSYNSSISYSQSRVQVGWHTLIRPDGYQLNLGNMNATDAQGASGLRGFINDHPLQYLKALALTSAFTFAGMELKAVGTVTKPDGTTTTNPYIQQLATDALTISNRIGEKLIDRALDVQPTITIKSGTKINIVANTNIVMPPFELFEVTQSYHKK